MTKTNNKILRNLLYNTPAGNLLTFNILKKLHESIIEDEMENTMRSDWATTGNNTNTNAVIFRELEEKAINGVNNDILTKVFAYQEAHNYTHNMLYHEPIKDLIDNFSNDYFKDTLELDLEQIIEDFVTNKSNDAINPTFINKLACDHKYIDTLTQTHPNNKNDTPIQASNEDVLTFYSENRAQIDYIIIEKLGLGMQEVTELIQEIVTHPLLVNAYNDDIYGFRYPTKTALYADTSLVDIILREKLDPNTYLAYRSNFT